MKLQVTETSQNLLSMLDSDQLDQIRAANSVDTVRDCFFYNEGKYPIRIDFGAASSFDTGYEIIPKAGVSFPETDLSGVNLISIGGVNTKFITLIN